MIITKDDREIELMTEAGRIVALVHEKLKEVISLQNEFGEKRLRGEDDFFLERHVSQNYYKLLLDEDMRDFFKYRKELADTFVSVYNTIADESFVKTFGITLS